MLVYILSLEGKAQGVYEEKVDAQQRKQMMLRSNPEGGIWTDEQIEILEWTVQSNKAS